MAHATVALSGTFTKLDGTPAEGTVHVRPSVPVIRDSAGDVVLSGAQRFPLESGGFTADLPATDDPNLNPTNFTYTVSVAMRHAYIGPLDVELPAAAGTVNLADHIGPGNEWVSREYVDAAILAANPLTVSDTEPSSGLWAAPTEEA